MIRPIEPITLPEGEELEVILLTHDYAPQSSAQMLADIASLPIEGAQESFSGADHDAVLYPSHKPA